jgi:signal transduction histidine kinase
MRWLLYVRLIVLTAGTLLPFFWMVVILGHRRQRNFERVFFFLCLALTCFFGSSLLALNAQLFYATPPSELLRFAWTFLCLGVWLVPPLLVHLHVEYASLSGLMQAPASTAALLVLAYLPGVVLLPALVAALNTRGEFEFERPGYSLGVAFRLWVLVAIVVAAYWEERFAQVARATPLKSFHRLTAACLGIFFLALSGLFFLARMQEPPLWTAISTIVLALALVPLGLLIGGVGRFNFLQIGRQQNLIYAVFTVFLALLYLSFVRRAGQWLEPYLPPEATAALLLFLPVVFFEPLQRLIRRLLQQTAQSEVDRAQKMMGPINEVARLGERERLRAFAESWIAEQLQLAEVHLMLDGDRASSPSPQVHRSRSEEWFEIRRGSGHLGTLNVRSHGAMVSGETFAALEFLCEQLPAAFDLSRLIGEKLQLERELAERERLALVGQMAASISHNLKNPLGSIKTILQVQMENPDLPPSMRKETQMVLDEIRRLSEKLNQLLQFSRPGGRGSGVQDRCDLNRVAENVAEVFRREAEQRGVALELKMERLPLEVAAGAEVANDILSNLLLNAIEAAPAGGHIRLSLVAQNGHCHVSVEDDGPGIPSSLKEKVLQPFFTTKARGTGLGLAIVQRRLEELAASLTWQSPVANGRGTCFYLKLPLAPAAADDDKGMKPC